MRSYRFSFDLGTTSVGWAVFEIDPETGNLVRLARTDKNGQNLTFPPLGVRIFQDGRNAKHESNTKLRRDHRLTRRQRDRTVVRRKNLMRKLEQIGWLPVKKTERDSLFSKNPYKLRYRAACEKVTLAELARVFWHISKHRGFRSNRKIDRNETDSSKNEDTSKIKSANNDLREHLEQKGYATYGCYLYQRFLQGCGTRVRMQGEEKNEFYEFYPTRDMLEKEFDHIWDEQAKHHELSDELKIRIRDDIIFKQRDLKPVIPGRCTFLPEKPRLPKWHPAAQAFLTLQELANLRVLCDTVESPLSLDMRKELFNTLNGGKKLTWTEVRKRLHLSSGDEINLQAGGLKHLHFNQVAANLAGTTRKPGPLVDHWSGYNTEQRAEILRNIAEYEKPEELIAWLIQSFGLDQATAEDVEKTAMPDGHLRFCKEVTEALVAEMRNDAIDYAEAVNRAPLLSSVDLSHSDFRSEKGVDKLPHYNELGNLRRMLGNGTGDPKDAPDKRLGKIANPSVHIALGQFRRVMNMLIQEFGKPAQVVLEAARDLSKSDKERKKINDQIKANTKRNDGYRKDLEEAGLLQPGQRVGDRFLKMRLWEELGRTPAERCSPFSGRKISLADLHSDAIEIEHILPFSKTFDDSPANKTLAFLDENRRKSNLSPGEAAAQGIFDQKALVERTRHYPRNKAWRFLPDAMEKFEEQKSFDDRQLHATGFIARVARAYAESLFDKTDLDGKRRNHVWMLPGRLTAMLRHRWGLNTGAHKNRNDHRHHAIDAAVIGTIDPAMIKRLQDAAKTIGAETLSRVLPNPQEPFPGYREQVLDAVKRINISHRARHGKTDVTNSSHTSGQLHEDSAYGPVLDLPKNRSDLEIGNIVKRKKVTELTDKEIGQIRDVKLRKSVLKATEPSRVDGLKEAERKKLRLELLWDWSRKSHHRRVRILKTDTSALPVNDKNGTPYKYLVPGENSYIDIIEVKGKWHGHAISVWDANSGQTKSWQEIWPDGKFTMRLYKGDTLQLQDWDRETSEVISYSNTIKRVVFLQPSANRICLCGQYDAGFLKQRKKDQDDPFDWDLAGFNQMRLRRARRVRIDEIGRVHTIPHGKG